MSGTLAQYRSRTAKALGPFVSSTVASGSTTTLVDTTSPIKSSIVSAKFYDNWYLFRPNAALAADKVRNIDTYDPSTGTLTPDLAWTNAPLVGESYELHGLVEPLTMMTDIINEALKRCFVTFESTLVPTALATRHALSTAAPWVDAEWKVRSVGVLSSGQDRTQINPYQSYPVRGYVTNEGRGTFYINHYGYSFNTTDTVYLWTIASGYSQCNAASFPGGTQSGLSLETDGSVCSVEWVAQAALIEAYERFGNIISAQDTQRLEVDQAKAATKFTTLTRQNFILPALGFQPLVPLGPWP